MLYPSINKIRTKADSRYTLVILAAKRSRDIIEGVPKLTEADVTKPVSIAANEIAEALIRYRTGYYSRWIFGACPCGSQLKRLDKVIPGEGENNGR